MIRPLVIAFTLLACMWAVDVIARQTNGDTFASKLAIEQFLMAAL